MLSGLALRLFLWGPMKNRSLRLTLAAAAAFAFAAPALAQECTLEAPIGARAIDVVYVPNRADGTISVVDVTPGSFCLNQVIATFGFAPFTNASPSAVVASRDGKRAYTINSNHDAVGVIDTRTSTMLYEIPVDWPSGGLALAGHPLLDRIYVSNLLAGSVSVIDTNTDTVIANVPVNDPAFVLGGFPPPLTGFELTFPASESFPIGLAVTPDGSELWVAVEFPGMITIIDTATNTVIDHVHFDRINATDYFPPLPVDVAFSGSGAATIAHVVTLGRNEVDLFGLLVDFPDVLYRIDVTTRTVIQTLVGTPANGLGPGAAEVTVANTGDTWISNAGVLDPVFNIPVPPYTDYATVVTAGLGSSTRSTLADSPVGVATSPAGDFVYVANFTSGDLSIFDADSGAPPVVVPVGNGPVTPDAFTLPALPTPPQVSGPCGQNLAVASGNLLSFTIEASTIADDAEDDLTLVASGLPHPLLMNPVLPVVGSDAVASDFSWVPTTADLGNHVITYSAEGVFETTQCQVTISVSLPPPPVFVSPADGQAFQVFTGAELAFLVQANGSGGFVVLDLLGGTLLPGTATMSPPLPTDGGSANPSSTFSWTPAPGEEGIHSITFTATDGFGQQTQIAVTVEVLEPPDFVPFDPFQVRKLHIDKRPRKGTFDFQGRFGVGADSDGIEPLTEDVTIELDAFSLTIPAGSFRERGHGNYRFTGLIDGVRVDARLQAPRGGGGDDDDDEDEDGGWRHRLWSFAFKGKYANLSALDNPIDAALHIGNDGGVATVRAKIKG
jgi:YVTN family beta-propeller protein